MRWTSSSGLSAASVTHHALTGTKLELVDESLVLSYLADMQAVLDGGSITEQKGLIRGFVKSVVKEGSQVTINDTLPFPPAKRLQEFCLLYKMVGPAGIEPATCRL